jgi:hypothetical protein
MVPEPILIFGFYGSGGFVVCIGPVTSVTRKLKQDRLRPTARTFVTP